MMINIENLSKSFKGKQIFNGVDLTGDTGEIIGIKGKSGVGKSTLINIIAGLEAPTGGRYSFDGEEMVGKSSKFLANVRSLKMGYVSQFSPMIPNLSVLENICVPTWFKKGVDKDQLSTKVHDISTALEIKELLDMDIGKLSGGQIQRVGIARSLINTPKLVVADEPTGSLDDETAVKVMDYFHQLKTQGILFIIVTHSGLIADQCDRVYSLTSSGLDILRY